MYIFGFLIFIAISKRSLVGASGSSVVSPVEETKSVYTRWLRALLGVRHVVSPDLLYSSTTAGEWVLIEPISKDDAVFKECFDPAVSGDWNSVLSEFEDSDFDTLEETLPVASWVFGETINADFQELELDLARADLWRDSITRMKSVDVEFLSYIESIMDVPTDSWRSVIDRDVVRTLPVNLQPRIERILYAYSVRNPNVGYCQGMNYLLSTILQKSETTTDEEAFDVLSLLVEEVNVNFYDAKLSGYHFIIEKLHSFLKVHEFEIDYKIPFEVILPDALMTIFTRLFPVSASLRVLDVGLAHGRVGIFAVYLAILKLAYPAVIVEVSNAEEGLEMALGGTEFRLEAIRIGANRFEELLETARDYFQRLGPQIEAHLNNVAVQGNSEFVAAHLLHSDIAVQDQSDHVEFSVDFTRIGAMLVDAEEGHILPNSIDNSLNAERGDILLKTVSLGGVIDSNSLVEQSGLVPRGTPPTIIDKETRGGLLTDEEEEKTFWGTFASSSGLRKRTPRKRTHTIRSSVEGVVTEQPVSRPVVQTMRMQRMHDDVDQETSDSAVREPTGTMKDDFQDLLLVPVEVAAQFRKVGGLFNAWIADFQDTIRDRTDEDDVKPPGR